MAETPLIDALRQYVKQGVMAFHTPGHKQGKGIDVSFADFITPLGFKAEVSLMDELDDLFEPHTYIKKAQDLAARLYGADASFFMVNGTTGAIHIMLLAALNPGDQIILPRNVHRSVLGGLILGGLEPIFIEPVFNEQLGIEMALEIEQVEEAIKKAPRAKALLLVYPTYYGIACDIAAIAKLVHEKGMLLLVDNAHGPHLSFSEQLPVDALSAGADMVAQSTHKILTSLTQTSMLHVKGKRIDLERVKQVNAILQSTSPNYLLLASLDAARAQMEENGAALMKNAINLAQSIRQKLNEIEGIYCPGEELIKRRGCHALDCTKLIVNVRSLGLSGYEVEAILRNEYNIAAELSDMYNVLFIISVADGKKQQSALVNAFSAIAARAKRTALVEVLPLPALPQRVLLPRQAAFSPSENVLLSESEGRIAAETVTFYPPGIPLLYPGEVISASIISYIRRGQKAGAKITGPADATLKYIKVIAKEDEKKYEMR